MLYNYHYFGGNRRFLLGARYMFQDRTDAGTRLALALSGFRDKNALVLAIPRGGVEVGFQIAKHLKAEFGIIVVRKLPYPENPEAGFGAIAEDGSEFIAPQAQRRVGPDVIDKVIRQQKNELNRRIQTLRRGLPLPEIQGRSVILVDDGIAMGSTMRASIMLCKNKRAGKIIVASPVAGPETAKEIALLVDEIVIMKTPRFFQAVAQVYMNWYDVGDDEVIRIMRRWEEINRNISG
jgi:predicted phosphoribosyltransferase